MLLILNLTVDNLKFLSLMSKRRVIRRPLASKTRRNSFRRMDLKEMGYNLFPDRSYILVFSIIISISVMNTKVKLILS